MTLAAERESADERLLGALHWYQQHPVKYVEHIVLGGIGAKPRPEKIEPHQADVLDLYAQHERVAIRAANGIGKDVVTAWIIEHFLVCFYKARIPVVSPTGRQVKRTIFSEVANWTKRSIAFPKLELLMTNELRHREAPEEWWALGFAPKVTADDPTGVIEGIHAPNLMFVITEAKAVDSAVWKAAQRMCTMEGNKMFAQSVPGPEAGDFYECFTVRARTWKTFHFPSARWNEDKTELTPTTRLVSKTSVMEKLAEGEDSPNFLAGVLAEFLPQGSTNLIPLAHVTKAMKDAAHAKSLEADIARGPREIGVDVARFGDDLSTIVPRHGPRVQPIETYAKLNEMQLAGRVIDAIIKHKATVVRIDNTGGYGGGVHDRIIELQNEKVTDEKTKQQVLKRPELKGVTVLGVSMSAKPTNPARWVNKRDELWDLVAESLKRGGALLPDDAQLLEELTMIRYAFTSAGQKKIEPKEQLKKRIGRSPDRADGVCLAFGGAEMAVPLALL